MREILLQLAPPHLQVLFNVGDSVSKYRGPRQKRYSGKIFVPMKMIIQELSKLPNVVVYFVDEYGTSSYCPECHEELRHVKKNMPHTHSEDDEKKQKQTPVHAKKNKPQNKSDLPKFNSKEDQWGAKRCVKCHVTWSRDIASTLLIALTAKHELYPNQQSDLFKGLKRDPKSLKQFRSSQLDDVESTR